MNDTQSDGKRGRIRPNTFNTPNEHVDVAMEMLTPEEYKVLNFVVRHTWGWQVDQKAISLTMFLNGYSHFRGVGLSRSTVMKCLAELSRMEFLIPVGKAGAKGQVWSVGLDPNLQALQDRFEASKSKQRSQITPARVKRGTSVYGVDRSMAQTDSGLSGRPLSVYGVDPIKDTSKDNLKESAASIEARTHTAASQDLSSVEANTDAMRFPDAPPPIAAAPLPKRERSALQKANDALVTAFREAWFKGRSKPVPDVMGNKDYGLYLKLAKELVNGGVDTSRFQAYVEHWQRVAVTGQWTLSPTALTNNGRIGDFLSQTGLATSPAHVVYDPSQDSSYQPLPEGGAK